MLHVGVVEHVWAELRRLHRRRVEVPGAAADRPVLLQDGLREGGPRLVAVEADQAHDHLHWKCLACCWWCHEKSPNEESPNKENPYEESPNKENPYEESPNKDCPNEKNPKEESPNEEIPNKESPNEVSPTFTVINELDLNKPNPTQPFYPELCTLCPRPAAGKQEQL